MTDDYSLVMPFKCVTSVGGPYTDEAFVAGFRAGQVDAELTNPQGKRAFAVEPVMREQYDLIAMKHGMTIRYLAMEGVEDQWLGAEFR